ncbi:MAG: sigma-70 family RNA polymerase sigma factor [Bacteroidetes bacterium]|nr:sigma-70 family RNA polymerase sigma factor [Bacteroidota bacterium]
MRPQLISDQKLIRSYLKGEEKALEILIERHKEKIFTSIYFIVKDRFLAEDIFQDTFCKVIDTLRAGKYREEGKFLPWVIRIGHNLCIDHFRKTKRNPTIETGEGFDIFSVLKFSDKNIQDSMVEKEVHVKVRALVDKLPPEQKEVVVLRHYGNMSFKEIAEITDVSINTALGRMRYALQNLRKIIEEKEISLL